MRAAWFEHCVLIDGVNVTEARMNRRSAESPSKPHVLVVDRATQATALQSLLVEEGLSAAIASDHRGVGEAIGALAPEVVIIDIALDRVDGRPLQEQVRSSLPATPIIVASGWPRHDWRVDRVLKLPNTHYLAKPIDLRALLAMIRNATRRTSDEPRRSAPAANV